MPSRNIPSLDGLRALSILFVIAAHATTLPGLQQLPVNVGSLANLGVRIFFVISGFLITTLLLKEYDRSGAVDLRRFYFRRTLRIFPPYYVFLALVAAYLALVDQSGLSSTMRWWPAVTYTSNYFETNSWIIGHSWSLSVEEQFYLVWPVVLGLIGRERAVLATLVTICAAPVVRLGVFLLTHSHDAASHWEFDAIAVGAAVALLRKTLPQKAWWNVAVSSRRFLLLPAAVVAVHALLPHAGKWAFAADILVLHSIDAVVIAMTLTWCIDHPTSSLGRVLNLAPVRAVGIISYSLYLWQQIFVGGISGLRAWQAIPAAFGAAAVSYYLVERPSLRVRALLEQQFRWTVERVAA